MKIWVRETVGSCGASGSVKDPGLKGNGGAGSKSGRMGRGLGLRGWGGALRGRSLNLLVGPMGRRALEEGAEPGAGSWELREAAAAAEDGCGWGGGHSADARSRADR